jgi:hypothetical protein
MDISLAVIPWRILWHVQMRLAEKIGVSIAMSLGVLYEQLLELCTTSLTLVQCRSNSHHTIDIREAAGISRYLMSVQSKCTPRHPLIFPQMMQRM